MLILAGGGMSIAGALVVFGALTGRLAAMSAAVFKPADLDTGYFVRPGVVDPLGTATATLPPASIGGPTTSVPDFLGSLIPGAGVPAPQVAPVPGAAAAPVPGNLSNRDITK